MRINDHLAWIKSLVIAKKVLIDDEWIVKHQYLSNPLALPRFPIRHIQNIGQHAFFPHSQFKLSPFPLLGKFMI